MVIYAITNTITNKIYIGSAVNFERRRKAHLYELKNNKHHSVSLQHSWNKHSPEDFVFSIIEEINDRLVLLEREQFWLDHFKSYNKKYGYNISNNSNQPKSFSIPVYQFTMNGNLIKKWNSCQEAGDYLGIDGSGLNKCAKGKYRFYYGYIWDYNKKLSNERIQKANNGIKRTNESKIKMSISAKNRTDHNKPILQYDLNNNFIKEWRSTSDVINEYHFSSSGSISECLHNKRKTAFGYIWKFKPV